MKKVHTPSSSLEQAKPSRKVANVVQKGCKMERETSTSSITSPLSGGNASVSLEASRSPLHVRPVTEASFSLPQCLQKLKTKYEGNEHLYFDEVYPCTKLIDETFKVLQKEGWHKKGPDCLKPRSQDILLQKCVEDLKNRGWHDPGDCPEINETLDFVTKTLEEQGWLSPEVLADKIKQLKERLKGFIAPSTGKLAPKYVFEVINEVFK